MSINKMILVLLNAGEEHKAQDLDPRRSPGIDREASARRVWED